LKPLTQEIGEYLQEQVFPPLQQHIFESARTNNFKLVAAFMIDHSSLKS